MRNLEGDLRPSVACVPGVIKQGALLYLAANKTAPDLAASQDLDLPCVPGAKLGQGPHPNYPMLGSALLSLLCVQPWQVAPAWNSSAEL